MNAPRPLDALAQPGPGEGQPKLAATLQAGLTPLQLALLEAVADQAQARAEALYIVGGFVRDLLLGVEALDFDLVLEGDAIQLAEALAGQYGGSVQSHRRFGTATWHIGAIKGALTQALAPEGDPDSLPEALDIVTARRERYQQPGALPDVAFDDIEQDLLRRDFTLNALALRLDAKHFGQLVDPWGGLADLRAGRLRVLHERSFADDPTRMLRIARFAERFDFTIAESSEKQLRSALPKLEAVSGDRLRHELEAILALPQRAAILARLQDLGVLAAIQPGLHFDARMRASLDAMPAQLPEEDWRLADDSRADLGLVLWLMHMDEERLLALAKRLNFSNHLQAALQWAGKLGQEMEELGERPPSGIVLRLEGVPPLALYALYLNAEEHPAGELLARYEQEWRLVQPGIDGHDLQARGLEPGPRFAYILEGLRAAWLDGEINSAEEEAAFLKRLITDSGSDDG